jgi:hypothetical protein
MEIKTIKTITKQHRATADQRLQMVEKFRQSGLTRLAFSQQYGVPLATLSWWLRKTKGVSNLPVPVPVLFSEVKLAKPGIPPDPAWGMEIVAPSGLTIRCREQVVVRDLARLIRGGRC